MSTVEARYRANKKYDDKNTARLSLKLNKNTDKDIIEKLRSVPNMQGYIKELIRNDLK